MWVLSSRPLASFAMKGLTVHDLPFDVCDPAAVIHAVDSVEVEIGPIDVLVNNAGLQRRAPLLEFAVENFRELIEVNLVAAFTVGQAVARHMVGRGRGKIVNICSVQSELGRPTIAPYTATKGGLKMLTRGMCADLGPLGIQVNALAPAISQPSSPRPWLPTSSSPHGSRKERRPDAGDTWRNSEAPSCSCRARRPVLSTDRSSTSTVE